MALLNCKHCGGIVSDKATTCPHCGAPLENFQEDEPQHPLHENIETQPADIASQKAAPLEQEPSNEEHSGECLPSEGPSNESPSNESPEGEGTVTYEEESSSHWLRWTIAIIVVLIAVAGFLFYNRNKTMGESVVESMNTDSTVVEEVDTIVHITPEFSEAIQKYDYLGEFSEGFAAVRQNDKWGFINVRGEEVISCQYDEVTPFHEGRASVNMGKQWGYIDSNNEMVIPLFEARFANAFSEGLAYIVGIPTNNTYKYRVIDTLGNTVFSGTTDWNFVYEMYLEQECPIFRDGKIGIGSALYDRTGKKVSENGGETFETFVGNYTIFAEEKDGIKLYGLKDVSDNIVVPAKYADFPRGYAGKCNAHNGVVAVCLPPDNINDYLGYDFDGFEGGFYCEKWYYGYADLNDHDTFSDDLKERCYRTMKEAWQKFKEKRDEESANNQNYSEEGGNGYGSSSSQNDDEWRIMTRLSELGNEGRKLINELAAMRNSGNIDPWRMIYIKKRCISIKDEQISLSQELGDSQMARQYEQQKEQLVQAFRMMDP